MTATPTTAWQWDEGIALGVNRRAQRFVCQDDTPFVVGPTPAILAPLPDDNAPRRRPQSSAVEHDEINPLAYAKGEFLSVIASQWPEQEKPNTRRPQLVKAVDEVQWPVFTPTGMFIANVSPQWHWITDQNPTVRLTPKTRSEPEERIDAPFKPGEFFPGASAYWLQPEHNDQNPRLRATPRTKALDEEWVVYQPMKGEFLVLYVGAQNQNSIFFLMGLPATSQPVFGYASGAAQFTDIDPPLRRALFRVRTQEERSEPPVGKGEFTAPASALWHVPEQALRRRGILALRAEDEGQAPIGIGASEFRASFVPQWTDHDVPGRLRATPRIRAEDEPQASMGVPKGMFLPGVSQWAVPDTALLRARRFIIDSPAADATFAPPAVPRIVFDPDAFIPRRKRAAEQSPVADMPPAPVYPVLVDAPDLILPRRRRIAEAAPIEFPAGLAYQALTPKAFAADADTFTPRRRRAFEQTQQGDIILPARPAILADVADLPALARRRRIVEQAPATDIAPSRSGSTIVVPDAELWLPRKRRLIDQAHQGDVFASLLKEAFVDPDPPMRGRRRTIVPEDDAARTISIFFPPPAATPSAFGAQDDEQALRVLRYIRPADWSWSANIPEMPPLPPLPFPGTSFTYQRQGAVLRAVSLLARQRIPAINNYVAGDSLKITFTIRDEQGLAIGLIGATAIWTLWPIILDRVALSPILTHTSFDNGIQIIDPINSVIRVTINPGEFVGVGDFLHELKIRLATGEVYTAARGLITSVGDIF